MPEILQIGSSEMMYYRWSKKYGAMGAYELNAAEGPGEENQRLRRVVSGFALDKLILTEAAKGSPPAAAQR